MESKLFTLDQCSKEQKAIVYDYLDENTKNKLMVLGMVPGAIISIGNKIPLSAILIVNIDTAIIAIREEDAMNVVVLLQ